MLLENNWFKAFFCLTPKYTQSLSIINRQLNLAKNAKKHSTCTPNSIHLSHHSEMGYAKSRKQYLYTFLLLIKDTANCALQHKAKTYAHAGTNKTVRLGY